MDDLHVPPGPGIPQGLRIPAHELAEQFTHASGPGGQGVNTSDSRVQLSLDIAACTAFTDVQRARLLNNLAGRLVGTTLTVDAADQRSQFLNRRAARERLADALRHALAPPPPARRRTRPTRGSVARRLAAKRHQAEKKALRRSHED